MNIYASSKVKPYVYVGIHKITGEIYIGYREDNVRVNRTSDVDLFEYRTSSKVVNPRFDEYDWIIVAEFDTGNDAYDFEQQLIFENWMNPLLLNKNCHYGNKKRFKTSTKGRKVGPQSLRSRIAKSVATRGIPKSASFGPKVSAKLKGRPTGRKGEESPKKGIPQEIIICSHCGKTGGESNMRRYHFENCSKKIEIRPTVTCPHCQKTGGINVMSRWHFENCKMAR
jgi:hypothetical protein